MDQFPIPTLDRLPTQISPCPIIDAVLELRFVTAQSWELIPGLLFQEVRERYPKLERLPLADMPQDIRRDNPEFTYQALARFPGDKFSIQLGPRMISLVARGEYPGWTRVAEELEWLLDCLEKTAIVAEGERMSMRYIDFFPGDVFPNLQLDFMLAGEPIEGSEISFVTAFRRDDFTAQLKLSNGAIVRHENEAIRGSVIDLDLWLGSSDFDIFENAITRFKEAHILNKQVFFGLLKSEFLSSLHPQYDV